MSFSVNVLGSNGKYNCPPEEDKAHRLSCANIFVEDKLQWTRHFCCQVYTIVIFCQVLETRARGRNLLRITLKSMRNIRGVFYTIRAPLFHVSLRNISI